MNPYLILEEARRAQRRAEDDYAGRNFQLHLARQELQAARRRSRGSLASAIARSVRAALRPVRMVTGTTA